MTRRTSLLLLAAMTAYCTPTKEKPQANPAPTGSGSGSDLPEASGDGAPGGSDAPARSEAPNGSDSSGPAPTEPTPTGPTPATAAAPDTTTPAAPTRPALALPGSEHALKQGYEELAAEDAGPALALSVKELRQQFADGVRRPLPFAPGKTVVDVGVRCFRKDAALGAADANLTFFLALSPAGDALGDLYSSRMGGRSRDFRNTGANGDALGTVESDAASGLAEIETLRRFALGRVDNLVIEHTIAPAVAQLSPEAQRAYDALKTRYAASSTDPQALVLSYVYCPLTDAEAHVDGGASANAFLSIAHVGVNEPLTGSLRKRMDTASYGSYAQGTSLTIDPATGGVVTGTLAAPFDYINGWTLAALTPIVWRYKGSVAEGTLASGEFTMHATKQVGLVKMMISHLAAVTAESGLVKARFGEAGGAGFVSAERSFSSTFARPSWMPGNWFDTDFNISIPVDQFSFDDFASLCPAVQDAWVLPFKGIPDEITIAYDKVNDWVLVTRLDYDDDDVALDTAGSHFAGQDIHCLTYPAGAARCEMKATGQLIRTLDLSPACARTDTSRQIKYTPAGTTVGGWVKSR